MPMRPNIVVIVTDQQRSDCVGYANPVLETPYLDDLASQGVKFSRCYTASPSCLPSRAAMMTGMDQWTHGRLGGGAGYDALDFPATLAGELMKAGYHTQSIGKSDQFPRRALYGFFNAVQDSTGRGLETDYKIWLREQTAGKFGDLDHGLEWNSWMARPSHLPEHLHPTYWTASEAVKFIERRDPTCPFFLWLSFSRPHAPYDPPPVYFDMYKDNPDIPMPPQGDWAEIYDEPITSITAWKGRATDAQVHRTRAAYYGAISFIDHQVGRFLYEFGRLERAAMRNTFFVFTSDHGDMLGDHCLWRKGYSYDGSSRIPFFIKYPDTWSEARGGVCDEIIEVRDIMPTVLDAAAVDIPDCVDGKSVIPLARGEPTDWREYLQGEQTNLHGRENGMQFIVNKREKYTWFHHTGKEQYFDLIEDPQECHDLAGNPAAKDRIEAMRSLLARVNEERGDPRGQGGKLVVQPDGAFLRSPNYAKWKARADERMSASGIRGSASGDDRARRFPNYQQGPVPKGSATAAERR